MGFDLPQQRLNRDVKFCVMYFHHDRPVQPIQNWFSKGLEAGIKLKDCFSYLYLYLNI